MKLLTTGQFAKLCRTQKGTLFFYDKEGLLKPKYISENGYRRYGVEQFFDFDMITMLKETGSTLKEIKAYIRNLDGDEFLSLLETKRLIVRKERKRLAQREQMLNDMAVCTREAMDFNYDTVMVQRQEEENLEIFPTNAIPSQSVPEMIGRISEYMNFFEKQERVPRYPFGALLSRDEVAKGRYLEQFFFSRATHSTPPSQLHRKQGGTYAVLAHRGTVLTHMQAFSKLLRHIESANLSIVGHTYVYDMMSYIFQGPGERYTVKYCVLVE